MARHDGVPGVGLGLSIVRTVARAHGGDVVLEPRAGGGLRVLVRLPGGEPPATSWAPPTEAAARFEGASVPASSSRFAASRS
jgi:hypothetical protein